ncbi:hypothetical protein AWB80_05836 [Caballeronia pedi]|uniref:Lipoprotein n=1 Tax=Caballeronia pedi TaxID=1777141 RepID=A0A158CTU1_9BURK|nr:hypothetical protein [Caballeronia pedi]SAK85803.1 hypothetical protein AWB80_05836 [Caballeronia pedi]
MKKRMLLVAWLGCIAMSASARQPHADQISKQEWNFDGCHFMLTDLYGGRTTRPEGALYIANINPLARHPFDTSIQFSCENPASAKTYLDLAGIRMTGKEWALDPSPENVGLKEQRTTFQALRGKGWAGGGVTQDDINGDEQRRTRIYAFCIPHNQLALCGVVRHVGYLMWPKETTLPQVIKLLESIEFIDSSEPSN